MPLRTSAKTDCKTSMRTCIPSMSVTRRCDAITETPEFDGQGKVVEEIITVCPRHTARAAADTPGPVDFFTADRIESVNSSDLLDVISTVVPSFAVERLSIADGASFNRPSSLRGLDAHPTLVLVNGKRRHRGALVRLNRFRSAGCQPRRPVRGCHCFDGSTARRRRRHVRVGCHRRSHQL